MAKSNFDKLLEAIEAAKKIKDEAVVGGEPGQFTQEAIDALVEVLDSADAISTNRDSEPSVYEAAMATLVKAVKEFKESVIPVPASVQGNDADESKEQEESKLQTPQLQGVVLRGWEGGRQGTHTIHLKKRIVSFIDGKADVSDEIAEELKKAGYIE